MNFLKKKLKPLTSGLTSAAVNVTSNHSNTNKHDKVDKDLEDDLYDEYVVEAPPHPSELLALGVDPTDIDVNNPEKLKELYRRAKEEGKDKKTNSVLLAKQRQKEEIEEKKKTREEWKFFDNLTARVEQVVKDSQKTLNQLKETSAIDKLTEPEYELRLSADQVFKTSATVKQEKGANQWIDFSEEDKPVAKVEEKNLKNKEAQETSSGELDEFGCSKKRTSIDRAAIAEGEKFVVEELLQDFGIDLRSADQKKKVESQFKSINAQAGVTKQQADQLKKGPNQDSKRIDIDIKVAARPRPRPNSGKNQELSEPQKTNSGDQGPTEELDPFDTSFVAAPSTVAQESSSLDPFIETETTVTEHNPTPTRAFDPFDTSYINL